ncbi:MAG: beta-galactosidase [Clostridia bacterium]|nr:beta-galactosidase [Clostridia bacterium]
MNIPRPEYPRPQFARSEWMNLNGKWQFEIDDGKSGKERKLYDAEKLATEITLPFCPESKLSGLAHVDFMECVWYMRTVDVPAAWLKDGRRTMLNIGACDFETEVYVNGKYIGRHIGGYVSFAMDITDALNAGENKIVICAQDFLRSQTQPGGKQCRKFYSLGCSYTRTTGIWQTVWLENMPNHYIGRTKFRPSLENQSLFIEAVCHNAAGKTLTAEAFFGGKSVGKASTKVAGKVAALELKLSELHLWSVGDGQLYDLKLDLDGDRVDSYFGMRKVEYKNGKTYINDKPVYQRLILDQGFYPDGIYTAPTEEELIADITRSMDMGFNGARLHQKVFEPRFLYHCDRLGYIVWGEHANWGLDISRFESWRGFIPEWQEIIERDFNHPAIIGWCPLNETQQNQNRDFVKMLADMTRSYDPDRLYIDASGWTHQDNLTDILDIHDYEQKPEVFREHYLPLEKGEPVVFPHYKEGGRPTFMSEFGGIWWDPKNPERGWGYGGVAGRPQSEEEFIERYRGLVTAMLENKAISAFCYTQLTDVEQEVNGLYTYDRHPKFPVDVIRAINTQKAAIEEE